MLVGVMEEEEEQGAAQGLEPKNCAGDETMGYQVRGTILPKALIHGLEVPYWAAAGSPKAS